MNFKLTVAADDDGAESDYGGIGGLASGLFDDDDSAEVAAPVAPAASRNDPETAADVGEVTTVKPKEKKNKKKKNVEEEGIMYEILRGILSYFS